MSSDTQTPMNVGLVTVAIPTRNRPDYLEKTLVSVTSQSYRPLEILISDDSTDGRTEGEMDRLRAGLPEGIVLRYQRNCPPLGQAANINSLFDGAAGRWVMLLHDDDLLLPHAIERLMQALAHHPMAVAAYGRQRICHDDGTDAGDAAADRLNRTYVRTVAEYGLQHLPVVAGILRQFPNDGYIVDAELARRVRYREDPEVGNGCESDFGVRVGLAAPEDGFVLVPEFTCVYRRTGNSMSTGSTDFSARYYGALESTKLPEAAEWARQRALFELAPSAVAHWAATGQRGRAIRVWFGPHFGRQRFTPRGAWTLLRIAFPTIDRLRRRPQPA
jgi:glycosyltransferase involved in cell wall biosynthesis